MAGQGAEPHDMRFAPVLILIIALPLFAGCLREGSAEAPDPDVGPSGAHFEVRNLVITPKDIEGRAALYEDDRGAVVRYVIVQPSDAVKETAFVTYFLNGNIGDVSQITLAPGEERAYERIIKDIRATPFIQVEVRAGTSIAKAESRVQEWPRAGSDALTLGPLEIRADYGLLQQDRRALVNLTLERDDVPERSDELRMRMVCRDANGEFVTTNSVPIETPAPGERRSVDVTVDDCRVERYAMEFLAVGEDARPLAGRLLLVPRGWTPAK